MVATASWDRLDGWCEILTLAEPDLAAVVAMARVELGRSDADETRAAQADRVAATCADRLGVGVLVNLGGDIAVRGPLPEGGWQVEIVDGGSGAPRPVIAMNWPGGLATARDPVTQPGSGYWRQITVAARSCERAGAAAGVALRLAEAAPRFLTQRELPARLLRHDGIEVQTNGWPRQRYPDRS